MNETKESCTCECQINYEAECERLSMIIMRQAEIIKSLKRVCYEMSDVMMTEERGIKA